MVSTHEAMAAALAPRPVQAWQAVVSVDAVAQQWARQGAPSGAVVVASQQASPRGHHGLPWTVGPDDACLAVVLRPHLAPGEEGILHLAGLLAASDAVERAPIDWPDRVDQPWSVIDGVPDLDRARGAVAVHTELGPGRVVFAVVSLLLRGVDDHAAAARAAVVALEEHLAAGPEGLADAARSRCRTLGHQVVARLVPLGPAGLVVAGRAVDLSEVGALVVEREDGQRVHALPTHVALLEPAPAPPAGEAHAGPRG